MKKIILNSYTANLMSKKLYDVSKRLNLMSCEVKSLINNLDMELMYKSRIIEHVDQISSMAHLLSDDSERMSLFIKNVIDLFEKTDSEYYTNTQINIKEYNKQVVNIPMPRRIPQFPVCESLPIVALPWIGGLISSASKFKDPITRAIENLESTYSTKPVKPIDGEYRWNPKNGFGVYRDGISTDQAKGHLGIDIQPNIPGENPQLKAVFGGRVVRAGQNGLYGNWVEIETRVDGKYYRICYAHLMDQSLKVNTGDLIPSGTVIGNMGSTGSSSGSHLHFEVREVMENDSYVRIDPVSFLSKNGIEL